MARAAQQRIDVGQLNVDFNKWLSNYLKDEPRASYYSVRMIWNKYTFVGWKVTLSPNPGEYHEQTYTMLKSGEFVHIKDRV